MSNQNKLWKLNKLICGDNLEEMAKLPKESIDLIYIDPPFFTNKKYEIIWGDEAEVRSYKDRWEGGIEHYISWLKPRVREMYRVLKPTGTFYIHCDWHANSYIRIMLDNIFGGENFRNEIVWCYAGGGIPKKDFPRKHDTIFRYTKTKNYTFNIEYRPYSESTLKVGGGRHSLSSGGEKLDIQRGTPINDWWTDLPKLTSYQKQWVGYPTQKPEALLERIIKISSNKGDVVADFFCGCGTTITVAQQLNRKWVGIDISPTAVKVMERRLEKSLMTVKGINYKVTGMPTTMKAVRKLEPFEFQNWVVIDKMRASASRKNVGDMGLDGYYTRSVLHKEAGIQVKQSDKVGRNVVDNFETALKRADYKKGYIVAFSFTRGAYEEVARVKKKEGLEIKLITVKDLLEKKQIT